MRGFLFPFFNTSFDLHQVLLSTFERLEHHLKVNT